MAILDVIADAGGKVVGDDMACCGRRLYPAGTSDDPFRRIAESMLGGSPDSTLGCSVGDRTDHLLQLATRTEASAVIFHVLKFCEPELFYLPQLRKALEQRGVRSVVLELHVNDAMPHQVVTRIEALLETTQ
jgi:benzoyl-CoA reductase subunit C